MSDAGLLELYLDDRSVWDSKAYQDEIHDLADKLSNAGVDVKRRVLARKSLGLETVVAGVAIGVPLLKIASDVLKTWIVARAGRQISVRVGDIEFKATSVDEVDQLIALVDARSGESVK